MSYALIISGFCLGFTVGMFSISTVSFKPFVNRFLRKTKLIKKHKAINPETIKLLNDF